MVKDRGALPNDWKKITACLDYQAFVLAVPSDLPVAAHQQLSEALKQLGRVRQELLGVAYVEATWGFLVVPPVGFPEIKINFFHTTGGSQVKQVLRRVAVLLQTAKDGRA